MNEVKSISQAGQIGLIVLLLLVVAATVAVAVSTRSVNELKSSRQEQQSSEAFENAEGAVQEALSDLTGKTLNQTYDIVGSNASYRVSASSSFEMKSVPPGKSISIEMDSSLTTALTISLKNTDGSNTCANLTTTPAMVVALYKPTGAVERFTRDLCLSRGNNFDDTGNGTLSLPSLNGYSLARVKVLYARANLSISGTNLPDQVYTVNATAIGDEGETRSIEASRGLPMAPSIFDYVLFSGSGSVGN